MYPTQGKWQKCHEAAVWTSL